MALQDLKLNRFLYKKDLDPYKALSAMNSVQDNGTTVNGGGVSIVASGLEPGTVVQSVLLQSSGSNDRVEINPDDNFYAYNNGLVVVQINKNGISSFQSSSDVLDVNNQFYYDGVLQPRQYFGYVDGASGTLIMPAFYPNLWTITKNGVGDYTITHGLGSIYTFVFVQSNSGHFRSKVVNTLPNSFQVTWQESDYDMSGNYVGEIPVDVNFQFQLNNLVP